MIQYKLFCLLPGFDTNCWLVYDDQTSDAVLIDPAAPDKALLKFILDQQLKVKYIVNTHGHGDHIGGNAFFKHSLNAPVCIHKADAIMLINSKLNLSAYLEVNLSLPQAEIEFSDDDKLKLGEHEITVIHTPGHTPGCISLLIENLLFSGDTLFYHDIGRTDLPGGDYQMILASVRNKLLTLPDETIVLPGHGQSSTIGEERKDNPYI